MSDADDIMLLLMDGRVYARAATDYRSDVWNDFDLLFYSSAADEKEGYTGYTLCKTCKRPFKHNRCKSGTSHLRTHRKRCAGETTDCVKGKIQLTILFGDAK